MASGNPGAVHVVVTIVIWVDDKRDRSIVNAFDELDGPIEKFVEAI
ncbi:hypothetical protein [Bradyrhizobium elkanii]|nr:hypothetical protein [Bradyrhizobium elkanii]MCP1932218.1 hypothetical protein [Bradyrhizobium elkanii]MCS3577242.1 hypothetical protein [Bradyrhizobium elkanii]MCS3720119.1 hypothetical protein [Bradyrhizobium elkanii]MCS4004536.1 hypothetical protein [Bradyrhizobium elkanii USDA 61]BBB99693.1 hypothetical protein BE61_51420 [Bradyrhizobium elkanii USDA 61]